MNSANTNLLKAKLYLKGVKMNKLASQLEISDSALYKKMNRKSEFTRFEISNIIKCLGLDKDEVMEIFFD
ncbi:XRE family transcriptional regulator [Metaclostridioides mangenotii]|uniref:XRE family transcriptional regulator n=1 Tax=Metaclostridioides mangenotii TaxID=1540 RepID=UPI0026EDE113|nr:XRE family transcriptional regulator [Clostridioides mangenotii]